MIADLPQVIADLPQVIADLPQVIADLVSMLISMLASSGIDGGVVCSSVGVFRKGFQC